MYILGILFAFALADVELDCGIQFHPFVHFPSRLSEQEMANTAEPVRCLVSVDGGIYTEICFTIVDCDCEWVEALESDVVEVDVKQAESEIGGSWVPSGIRKSSKGRKRAHRFARLRF